MNTLLIPTDFSPFADYAVAAAKEIALKRNSKLVLLHVLDYSSHIERFDIPGINPEFLNDLHIELKHNGETKIQELAGRLREEGLEVETVIKAGFPKDVILSEAKKLEADLIVMGTRGSSGLEEVLIGSNTERIVRIAPCPVLTIGEEVKDFQINNLVFVSDFEEADVSGFGQVVAFARLFGATIHMVRVNTPQYFENAQLIENRMAKLAQAYGLTDYTARQWDHVKIEAGMKQYADKVGAQALAIGTHGRRGLGHLFHGSLAEDVVNHLTLPVLTFRFAQDEKDSRSFRPISIVA